MHFSIKKKVLYFLFYIYTLLSSIQIQKRKKKKKVIRVNLIDKVYVVEYEIWNESRLR